MAILLSFVIVLPSVAMSLFYFSHLLNNLTVITDTDVQMGRMATDLSLIMLDTRRYERNYRLFGNPTEQSEVQRRLASADSILHSIQSIAPIQNLEVLNDLTDHLEIYSNSFSMLVEHISQNPPEQRLSDLSRNLNEFQATYRDILKELENATQAERDSIMSEKLKSLDEQTLNILSATETPGDPVYILENLEQSRQSFLESATELATLSWNNMQDHKRESQVIEAKAKRNIITVLMITIFGGVLMLIFLPRYIISPLTSLNRIFKKAREGDLSAHASVHTNDEIGDLALSYNQMIERMRLYDGLKTRKIASQKRAFDRLLEQLDRPACIVTDELKAIFYNEAFIRIFGQSLPKKAPDGGLDIDAYDVMDQFAAALKTKLVLTGNTIEFTYAANDARYTFHGRLVRNAVMDLESIVMVGDSDNGGGEA